MWMDFSKKKLNYFKTNFIPMTQNTFQYFHC